MQSDPYMIWELKHLKNAPILLDLLGDHFVNYINV